MNAEKALSKVRKLLALGNNAGATGPERERALTQANSLLLKYNLDMAALEGDSPEVERTFVIETYYVSPWTRTISAAVANLYFCKFLFVKGTRQNVFIGEVANANTAAMIAKHIVISIHKESLLQIDGLAFCRGAADSIHQRAHELKLANMQGQTTGNAMVLYDDHAQKNDEFVAEQFGKVSTIKNRKSRKLDYQSYHEGREYGNGVTLRREVK